MMILFFPDGGTIHPYDIDAKKYKKNCRAQKRKVIWLRHNHIMSLMNLDGEICPVAWYDKAWL